MVIGGKGKMMQHCNYIFRHILADRFKGLTPPVFRETAWNRYRGQMNLTPMRFYGMLSVLEENGIMVLPVKSHGRVIR